jgi:hypothetical protein
MIDHAICSSNLSFKPSGPLPSSEDQSIDRSAHEIAKLIPLADNLSSPRTMGAPRNVLVAHEELSGYDSTTPVSTTRASVNYSVLNFGHDVPHSDAHEPLFKTEVEPLFVSGLLVFSVPVLGRRSSDSQMVMEQEEAVEDGLKCCHAGMAVDMTSMGSYFVVSEQKCQDIPPLNPDSWTAESNLPIQDRTGFSCFLRLGHAIEQASNLGYESNY